LFFVGVASSALHHRCISILNKICQICICVGRCELQKDGTSDECVCEREEGLPNNTRFCRMLHAISSHRFVLVGYIMFPHCYLFFCPSFCVVITSRHVWREEGRLCETKQMKLHYNWSMCRRCGVRSDAKLCSLVLSHHTSPELSTSECMSEILQAII
jgi:hypothetical protein